MTIYVIAERREVYDEDRWLIEFSDPPYKETYYATREQAQAEVDRRERTWAKNAYDRYVKDQAAHNMNALRLQKEKEVLQAAGLTWRGCTWELTEKETMSFEDWFQDQFKSDFRVEELEPA